MSSNDNFKKVSIGVAYTFVSVVYNPLAKYCKSLKKSDLSDIQEFHDFLFNFKNTLRSRDVSKLDDFHSLNPFFAEIIGKHNRIYSKCLETYGDKLFDVSITIINKVLDIYTKRFK